MLHLKITIGLILIALALFAELRDSDVSFRRETPEITRVEALSRAGSDENDSAPQLRVFVATDCAVEVRASVSRYPDNIDIQLYRDLLSEAECRTQEDHIDLMLTLQEDRQSTYLIINSRVWQLSYPASDGAAHPSLTELKLFPLNIDEASIAAAADASHYQVSIRGHQAVGCDLPEIYSLRQTSAGVQLSVYNALAPDSACPDILTPVDAMIALSATDIPSDTLFSVNTFQIEAFEEQNVSESDKVLTNIFRVDVKILESQPKRIRLDVEGEHPDGCEYPVIVGQQRRGNIIEVEVYREVPADVFCPMILKPYRDTINLEGDFEPGAYTVKVNTHSQAVNI